MSEHPIMDDKQVEAVARAVREEIVRQHRDGDRKRCTAGSAFYEEHVAPALVARAAVAAYHTSTNNREQRMREALEHIAKPIGWKQRPVLEDWQLALADCRAIARTALEE